MNDRQTNLGVIIVAALIVLGYLFRFDFQIAARGDGPPIGYALNRWTGTIYIISPRGYRELGEDRPAQ